MHQPVSEYSILYKGANTLQKLDHMKAIATKLIKLVIPIYGTLSYFLYLVLRRLSHLVRW